MYVIGFSCVCILLVIYYLKVKFNADEFDVKDKYLPIIGHLCLFLNNRNENLKLFHLQYGNCFNLYLFNQRIRFLLDPKDWLNVNRNRSFVFLGETFSRRIFDMTHNFFGQAQLDHELQSFWNLFLKNSNELNLLNDKLNQQLQSYLRAKRSQLNQCGVEMNFFDFLYDLLFYSIGRTFYGEIELNEIRNEFRWFDYHIQYLFLLFPSLIYEMFFSRLFTCRNLLNKFWLKHVHSPNESHLVNQRTDFILNHRNYFSDKDYSGEKTFLLWSSISNTIPTLFWSLIHIFKEKNLFELISNEIERNSSVHLDSIIDEVLRLYSNPMIMRKAIRDFQFKLNDGRTIEIKQNDITAFYPHIAQTNHNYFTNPNQFQFDRFTNGKAEQVVGYLPFGAGKSMCPGRLFAKNAIKLTIIHLIQHLQIHRDEFQRFSIEENPKRQGIGVSHPQRDFLFTLQFK